MKYFWAIPCVIGIVIALIVSLIAKVIMSFLWAAATSVVYILKAVVWLMTGQWSK